MKKQKRVLAIHDISCVGKCSLTVALPIISAGGVECSVLPTALLSTHTGGFTGYTFHDLTSEVEPIFNHWKSLDVKFDSVYTGYLGSFEQLQLVDKIFDTFDFGLKLIDPVMADNGKLYASFSPDFPKGMRKLCEKADIIIPNITEACLMLDEEYKDGPYTEEYIENLLHKLADIGPEKIVLTGVFFEAGKLGSACFDADTGTVDYYFRETVDGYYHGTGDVFGSALLTAVLKDIPLSEACKIAVDFTVGSIIRTKNAGTDIRFGVDFEEQIPEFINDLLKKEG